VCVCVCARARVCVWVCVCMCVLSGIGYRIFLSVLPDLYSKDVWWHDMATLLCAVTALIAMFSTSDDTATKCPHCMLLPYCIHMLE
jgi:hypothetical protein